MKLPNCAPSRTVLTLSLAVAAIFFASFNRGRAGTPEPPNPAGNYGGILENDTDFDPLTAGLVEVKVTPKGTFTGRLTWQGRKYPFAGAFDGLGNFQETFAKRQTADDDIATGLAINLTLDPANLRIAANLQEQINGSTTVSSSGDLSGAPPSPAIADELRGQTRTSFIDSPIYGTGADSIGGDGFLIARIGNNKSVKTRFVGRLPDNEPFSGSSPLRGTDFTFISALYKDEGEIGGLAVGTISAADPENLASTILWGKKPGADPDYYPAGFLTGVFVSAGPYPTAGTRLPPIGITTSKLSVVVTLQEGNLGRLPSGDPVTYELMMEILPFRTKVIGENPLGLKMVTNGRKATFKGSFIHPESGMKTEFNGAFRAFKPAVGPNPSLPGEGRGSFKGSVLGDPRKNGPVQSGSVRIRVLSDM